jgi:hypothetical protein
MQKKNRGFWNPYYAGASYADIACSICLDYTADSQVGEVAGSARLQRSAEAKYSVLRN